VFVCLSMCVCVCFHSCVGDLGRVTINNRLVNSHQHQSSLMSRSIVCSSSSSSSWMSRSIVCSSSSSSSWMSRSIVCSSSMSRSPFLLPTSTKPRVQTAQSVSRLPGVRHNQHNLSGESLSCRRGQQREKDVSLNGNLGYNPGSCVIRISVCVCVCVCVCVLVVTAVTARVDEAVTHGDISGTVGEQETGSVAIQVRN